MKDEDSKLLEAMGLRIKEKREVLAMSQEELAERLGYKSRSSINKIEMGKVGIPQRKVRDLARNLKTSIEYLLDGTESETRVKDIFTLDSILPLPKSKPLPMLGNVSCGEPIYANREYSYIDGSVKADFCLRAQGNSMSGACIKDGSIVFCHRQEMVEDGEIAAILIGDEVTLKRFYYYKDNDLVILRPENPDYKDQVYAGYEINQIKVLGKAIAVQTTLK